MSKFIQERATALIAERVDDSTASTQSSRIEAEVFTELMGPERYGRVRGYGVGVTPTQLSAVSTHTCQAVDSAQDARVRRLEEEIEDMRRSRAEEIRQSHAEVEEIQQRDDANRTSMDSMRQHIERLTSVIQMFVPHQVHIYMILNIYFYVKSIIYIIPMSLIVS